MSAALTRLREGNPVFGVMQTVSVPTLTELAVWSGFDFVILDCEHSVVDEQAHLTSLQVISGSDAFAVVRIRPGDVGAVGRYLDYGVDAVLMPHVRTPTDVAAFVAAAAHAPSGTRSSTGSATRAKRYGLAGQANRGRPLLLVLIETAEAVANIAAIAATPGLDGLLIGAHDLSADLGCPNDNSAPVFNAAFVGIEQAATRAGLILGSSPQPGFPVERLLKAGHRFILAGADIVALREGYRSQLVTVGRLGAPVGH